MASTVPAPAPSPSPLPFPVPGMPTDAGEARLLAEEIRVGLDHMRHMSHDELRALVQSRIDMLNSVLTEREQRRVAIETARLAVGVLDIRRERAHTIKRRVDAWSAVAAAVCVGFIFVQL